jgi:uncharacterized protein YbjQ (UPF0145 family)
MSLPIFTIPTFNQDALQAVGAVFAQRVESISIVRNFFAGIGGIAGGRSEMMEKKMNDLNKAIIEEIQIQARKAYPKAVALVDLKITFSDIGKNDQNMFLAAQASATAIIRRTKASAAASPIPGSLPEALVPVPSPILAPMASPMASQPMASQPMASQAMASQPMASQPQAQPGQLNRPLNRPLMPSMVGAKRNLNKSRRNKH